MLEKEIFSLLKLLPEHSYVTSECLAEQLHLGMRTVRKRIKELNELLKKHGAYIDAKPRYGYQLIVKERGIFQKLMNQGMDLEVSDEHIPSTSDERIQYLLIRLLNQDGYIKAEDMIEFLCVSKGTFSNDLKQVELIIGNYGLALERRPNYGIKTVGQEFDIRRCMGALFFHEGIFKELNEERQNCELSKVAGIVLKYAAFYGIRFSEVILEKFIHDIYIQVRRIRKNHLLNIPLDDLKGLSDKEWKFVSDIQEKISELYKIEFSQEEQHYIAIHLAGKRMLGSESQNEMNFIIREDIDGLAVGMLENVYYYTRLDLRGNFELRMSLNQHLVPLDIRIRYDIPLENPMLDDIKENYMMGYTVASQASSVLKEYYKKEISENEIGYLALIFALALEQQEAKSEIQKTNILVVCNSGKGMSRLLMHRLKQVFDEYINEVYVSNLLDLEKFDFSKVDYVFTTVPIMKSIPVPIQEVGLFMEEKDIKTVRRLLEGRSKEFLSLYCRENFLGIMSGNTREEVLQNMCERIYAIYPHQPGLYEAVMERELLCSTDFGNLVSMPHPCKSMAEETYIYVAILEKPIVWSRYDVQVVLLMMIGHMEENELQDFYDITTKFISDKNAIKELIDNCSYDALIKGLKNQI